MAGRCQTFALDHKRLSIGQGGIPIVGPQELRCAANEIAGVRRKREGLTHLVLAANFC